MHFLAFLFGLLSLHFQQDLPLPDTLTIIGENIWIRDAPATGEVIMTLNTGDQCKVLQRGSFAEIRGMEDFWYEIEFEGKSGWVYGSQSTIRLELLRQLPVSVPPEQTEVPDIQDEGVEDLSEVPDTEHEAAEDVSKAQEETKPIDRLDYVIFGFGGLIGLFVLYTTIVYIRKLFRFSMGIEDVLNQPKVRRITPVAWFFGMAFGLVGLAMLWGAENMNIKTLGGIQEGMRTYVEVDSRSVDPANEGKLVILTGQVQTDGPVYDPDFGIALEALTVERNIFMYQYRESKEEKKKSSTSSRTTSSNEKEYKYTYGAGWYSSHIDSDNFHDKSHKNPSFPSYGAFREAAKNPVLGAFRLSKEIIGSASLSPYTLGELDRQRVAQKIDRACALPDDGAYLIIGSFRPTPSIGNLKLEYMHAGLGTYTIMGMQQGRNILPYITSNTFEMKAMMPGRLSAAQIFRDKQTGNTIFVWLFRGFGWIVVLGGIIILFGKVSTRIPVYGRLGDFGFVLFVPMVIISLHVMVLGIAWVPIDLLKGILWMGAGAVGYLAVTGLIKVLGGSKESEADQL